MPREPGPASLALARFLAAGRRAAGWTQHDLARVVDVTDIRVSRWENGHERPSPLSLEAAVDALALSREDAIRLWFAAGVERTRAVAHQPRARPALADRPGHSR